MVNSVIGCNFTSPSVKYPLKFITTIITYAQSAYSSTNATFNFRVKTYFKKSTTKSKKIQAITVNLESYMNNYKIMADIKNVNPHAIASSCFTLYFLRSYSSV